MLKAAFSFFSKQGAAENAAPAAPAPDPQPAVPPAPSPAADIPPVELVAPAEAPPAQSEHQESSPGNSIATYGALVGRKRKHYTEIYLDPGFLPRIRRQAKPDNVEYLSVKHELLDRAYHGLKPYVDFACSLKGVAGRQDLHKVLGAILKLFLTRYWDIPASGDNHHSYPWGFALHSLDVACGEAEKATSWMPMSENGIDEMSHAQDLGMVVLLHFARGLYHDAHKLYQYGLVWRGETGEVVFNPILHEGNVLDFKLVYPSGCVESWGATAVNPGKLNALEFISQFPRELWGKAPRSIFFDVFAALFDLIPSEADRESARRDTARAGRMTMEDMIQAAVKQYFADRQKTNPGLHVFRLTEEWTAVDASQFFLKIRPAEGVYTAEGVRSCLIDQGMVAGKPEEADLQFTFLVRYAAGKDRVQRHGQKVGLVKTAYLLEACPDLAAQTGEIYFLEKDRAQVLAWCPDAKNFIENLPEDKPGKEPSADAKEKSGKPEQNKQKDKAGPGKTPEAQKEKRAEPGAGAAPDASPPSVPQPVPATETASADAMADKSDAPDNQDTAAAAEEITEPVNWTERLRERLDGYTTADSSPQNGWLYCSYEKAFVRLRYFYPKLSGNPDILNPPGWAERCKPIKEKLLADGLLLPAPIHIINYIAPGGAEASLGDSILELRLPPEMHSNILSLLLDTASPSEE